MAPITTILVPTDFSQASQSALAYAATRAELRGANFVGLDTFESPIVGFPDGALVATADIASRIVNAAQKSLDDTVAQYNGRKVALAPLLKQGDPREVILA